MILPSNEFGKTTATVAYFDCGPESLARWLENELGSPWHLSSQSFESTTNFFLFFLQQRFGTDRQSQLSAPGLRTFQMVR
jgi:hypothetical protein